MDSQDPLNVTLLVGLPPAHFGSQQDKYRDYFGENNTVNFEFNQKSWSVFASEVVVYPQAFAAVAPLIAELRAFSKAIVVDIGGYTADLLKLTNEPPDLSICDSLEYGAINFYNTAIKRINSTIEKLYATLREKKVSGAKGHRNVEDVPCPSSTTIRLIHVTLKRAFVSAVE